MEYSIQNLSKSKVEISLNISKEEWAADVKKSYEKNKFKYSVEGFRKGKVPMNIVVKRYGVEVLYEDALDDTLSKHYSEILKNDNIDVVSDPDVDLKEVSEDGVKAVITVIVKPEFELGQYTKLTFKKDSVEVTDAEVDEAIDTERKRRARAVELDDGVVENGDTVILDYSGSVDGEKFDGGTAENQTLEIGSGAFIPGFEEQLVGMKKGEEKDINVKFPEQYTPELAGKDAVFAVKINAIQRKELQELDDEFVKEIDEEANTVAEYKEKIKAKLSEDKAKNAEYKLEEDIMAEIVKNTEIEIPECMIDEELDSRVQDLARNMQQYGMRFEDYLNYTGTTVDDIKKDYKDDAVKNIKTRLIMEAIIKKENIEFKPEELNAEFDKLQDNQKNSQYMSYLANKLIVDKLFDFLKANNTIN